VSEDQNPTWSDRHEAVGVKQGVDSRDEVTEAWRKDRSVIRKDDDEGGRERVTTDNRRGAGAAVSKCLRSCEFCDYR